MIPSGVQVFVALESIDLRWSFDRLAGAALERVGYDARSGALFIFFGKRLDAVKVLFADGSGMCQFYKRLDHGVFRLPEALEPGARYVEIDESVLDALLDGIDLAEAPKRRRAPRSRVRVH
jgi:transposase